MSGTGLANCKIWNLRINSGRLSEPESMPTRADFEKINAMIAEAVALCEASHAHFCRIHDELQKAIAEGRAITSAMLVEEDCASDKLFSARLRLSHYRRELSR